MRVASAIRTSDLMSCVKTTSTLPAISSACSAADAAICTVRLTGGCSIQFSVEKRAATITAATSQLRCVTKKSNSGHPRTAGAQVDQAAPEPSDDEDRKRHIRQEVVRRRRCDRPQARGGDQPEQRQCKRREDLIP